MSDYCDSCVVFMPSPRVPEWVRNWVWQGLLWGGFLLLIVGMSACTGCDVRPPRPKTQGPVHVVPTPTPAPKPDRFPVRPFRPRPECPNGACPNGGCPVPGVHVVGSLADTPAEFREANYAGGSCLHAALITVMNRMGLYDAAKYWRQSHSGAAGVRPGSPSIDVVEMANTLGLQFAYTAEGNEDFLEWCSRTRRGAAIHYFPVHAVFFERYEGDAALLIDNNRTSADIRIPKQEFVRRWKQEFGGRAITLVYPPMPAPPSM